jgi:serine/threonine protein kinase
VRELRLWANLNHPNVLAFLGFTLVERSPSLVSEWMDNGTVLEYVKRNAQTSAAVMVQTPFANIHIFNADMRNSQKELQMVLHSFTQTVSYTLT